jgi:exopolysaccharide biosynthesis protein
LEVERQDFKSASVASRPPLFGADANRVRTAFGNHSVENAVFLDCSDSATLYYDGKFLVRPGARKNEFLTVAVGFK